MKMSFMALWLRCVLTTAVNVYGGNVNEKLNAPISEKARKLVAQSIELAGRNRFAEAVAVLQLAIKLSPNYVNAHAEYIQLKSNFLKAYDETRAEYETLMKKEPENPVYPMALAIAQYQTSETSLKTWRQKVIELAPEWSWAHYARALTILEKEPKKAVTELEKYIEADGSWLSAYSTLAWVQEKTLKNLDGAIKTAE